METLILVRFAMLPKTILWYFTEVFGPQEVTCPFARANARIRIPCTVKPVAPESKISTQFSEFKLHTALWPSDQKDEETLHHPWHNYIKKCVKILVVGEKVSI